MTWTRAPAIALVNIGCGAANLSMTPFAACLLAPGTVGVDVSPHLFRTAAATTAAIHGAATDELWAEVGDGMKG
jgi:hypothetical protein